MFVLVKCHKKLLNFHLKRTLHLLLCSLSVLFVTSTSSVVLLFETSKKKNLNRPKHQICPYSIILETEFKRNPYSGWSFYLHPVLYLLQTLACPQVHMNPGIGSMSFLPFFWVRRGKCTQRLQKFQVGVHIFVVYFILLANVCETFEREAIILSPLTPFSASINVISFILQDNIIQISGQ